MNPFSNVSNTASSVPTAFRRRDGVSVIGGFDVAPRFGFRDSDHAAPIAETINQE